MGFSFTGDSLKLFSEKMKQYEKETGMKYHWKYKDHKYPDDGVLLSENEVPLRQIIINDDYFELISYIKRLSLEERGNEILVDKLLRLICSHQALNCADALLNDETGLKVDINRQNCWGSFPLHEAARSLDSYLVNLFVCAGALTESEDYGELLPLRVALEAASSDEKLIQWTPGQSIFKLIIKLCLPKMREALQAIAYLARKTQGVDNMIRNYAEDSKFIELAILMMVGKAKVVQPVMYERENDTLNGNMTAHECINSNIASLTEQELMLKDNDEKKEVAQICKERKLSAALLLLDIFARTGDNIEAYVNLNRTACASEEYVTQEVATLLARAGFHLNSEDTGITNMVDRYPIELDKGRSIEFEDDDDDEHEPYVVDMWDGFELDASGRYTKAGWKDLKRSYRGSLSVFNHSRPIKPFSSSRASFCSGIARPICVQAERGTKGFQPYVQNSPLSKRLATLALAIKRGIRRI